MKPDWKDAPKGALWLAMDSDGSWYWHTVAHRPYHADGSWRSHGQILAVLRDLRLGADTLEARPEAK